MVQRVKSIALACLLRSLIMHVTGLGPIYPPNPPFYCISHLSQTPGPSPAPTPAKRYFKKTNKQ